VTGVELVFAGFALLTWVSAVLSVTSRQVVHAALWLVVALGSLAGVYLALGAQVVALVQLLVYVGAIVVLVLFALMLTRAPIGVHRDLDAPIGQRLAALGAGLGVAVLIGGVLLAAVGSHRVSPDLAEGSATSVGTEIFAHWLLPFELLSVLLLAALVAALTISRGRSDEGRRGGEDR
jgi:NADH-quinone oxidoreductase subunit J